MAYTKTSTPIVYYGGKTAILNHILPLIPEHEVYTEVFFGGGAVFFAKKPAKNEIINDRLDLVVNFYQVLQDDQLYPQLAELIDKTLISRFHHFTATRLINSHKKGNEVNRVQLAWAFFFSTNFSHMNKLNGGLKISNHPSKVEPYTLVSRKKQFRTGAFKRRIERTFIDSQDAIKVLKARNVTKAFHYQDSPYPDTDLGHYDDYTWDDFEKLLKWNQDECKGKFLLSNYNSPLLDEYIDHNGWIKTEITHRLKAPRKSGTTKTEVLVRNYENVCNTLPLFN